MTSMQQTKSKRLLLIPLPLQGHISPMLQLAQILYSNGFSITIIHTTFNSPNPSNYPHFNFCCIQDGMSETESSAFDLLSFLITLNTRCVTPFKECLTKLLCESILEEPITCLISDAMCYFTESVASSLQLPRIVLRTSGVSSFVAFAAFPLLREKGYIPIQESKLEEAMAELPPLRVKDLPMTNTKEPDKYYNLICNFVNSTKNSLGLIWNSFEELESSALSTMNQQFSIPMFPIGPFHKHFPSTTSSSNLIPQDQKNCISWLNKHTPKSVVYVSFGSIATINEKEFLEIAWGLANSNHPFLWVVRPGLIRGFESLEPLPSGFMESLEGRGCVVKWAPQHEMLAHKAIGSFWKTTLSPVVQIWSLSATISTIGGEPGKTASFGIMMNLRQYWDRDERDFETPNCNNEESHPVRLLKNKEESFSENVEGRALIGKVFHSTALKEEEVRSIVKGMWAEFCPVLISEEAPNIFLFVFEEKHHAAVILSRGPWFVMHHLLSLSIWEPVKPVNEVSFDFVSFWVQIYGIPRAYENTFSVKAIAETIGTLIEVENPVGVVGMNRSFNRVKVVVNIAKPLKVGSWVALDEETMMWVNFKYERLLVVCYNCGRIDHTQRDCHEPQSMLSFDPSQPKFGSFLCAQSLNIKSKTMLSNWVGPKEEDYLRKDFSGGHCWYTNREVGGCSTDAIENRRVRLNVQQVPETSEILSNHHPYMITEGVSHKEGNEFCKQYGGSTTSKERNLRDGSVELGEKGTSPIRETWYDDEGQPVCVTVTTKEGEQTFIFDDKGHLKPLSP